MRASTSSRPPRGPSSRPAEPPRLLAAALPRRLSAFPLLLAALLLGTMLLLDAAPAQAQSTPTVSLSAVQNPVPEGSPAEIQARLSSALAADVAISMTVTLVTAESGDLVGGTFAVTIPAGLTVITLPITTTKDTDADDETFIVALGTLPSSLTAGAPSSLTITIKDEGVALVSNVGQTRQTSTVSTDNIVPAQAFTTGSHTAGYTLKSIDAVIAATLNATQRATVRAELWSAGTDSNPGSKAASLTVPSTFAAGTLSFAAPANTTLTASTTYYFLLYTTGTVELAIGNPTSGDEDSGGAAGWSIANGLKGLASANTPTGQTLSWISVSTSRMAIRVKGAAVSNDATLVGLTAQGAKSETGTFSSLTLAETFAPATTAYTATAPYHVTHVKVTPTKAHSGASIKVGTGTSLTAVDSGSESDAIALDVGANAITVEVTAQDGTTKQTYTVTVTREKGVVFGEDLGAPAPFNIAVDESAGTVRVPITVSELPASSLVVQVNAEDITAVDGTDYTFGSAKTVTFSSTDTSKTRFVEFTVTDDTAVEITEYLKLSLVIPAANSPYSIVTSVIADDPSAYLSIIDNDRAAPTGKTFAITKSVTAAEGSNAVLTVTLGEAAPTGGVAFTVTPSYCACGPTDLTRSAVDADVGTVPSTVTVGVGSTTATLTIPIESDSLKESTEDFSVTITTTVTGWTAVDGGKGYILITDARTPAAPIWSATLNVKEVTAFRGCDNEISGAECSDTDNLSDDDFTVGGGTYTMVQVYSHPVNKAVYVKFGSDVRTALDSYKLCAGQTGLTFSSAAHSTGNVWAEWASANVQWSAGDTVSLSIVASGAACPAPIWSATLNVKEVTAFRGCDNEISGAECSDTDNLSDDDFTVGGGTYTMVQVYSHPVNKAVYVKFGSDVRTALDSYKLCAGQTGLTFSSAAHSTGNVWAEWASANVQWSAGDTVSLSIVASGAACPNPIWSATLKPKQAHATQSQVTGCDNDISGAECSTTDNLTDDDFTVGGQSYSILHLSVDDQGYLFFEFDADVNTALKALKVCVGSTAVEIPDGTPAFGARWINPLEPTAVRWSTADTVRLSIVASGALCPLVSAAAAIPTVSLSVTPNPVAEGDQTVLTATLSSAPTTDFSITVTVTAVTAESGDLMSGGFEDKRVDFPTGITEASFIIGTNQDADADDETFTVALGTLPSSVTAGTPDSVTIRITDDDEFLVSNLGQLIAAGSLSTANRVQSQGFTTGSHTEGYTLSSVEAELRTTVSAANRATIRAELWSAATGGGPDSKLASLTVPSFSTTAATNTVAFAAPANTTLTASTTYHFVIYTVGSFNASVGGAISNDEDSGGQTGWSVADVGYFLTADAPGGAVSWTDDTSKVGIRVEGAAKTAPVSLGRDGRMIVDVDDPWEPMTVNEGESITYYIALNQPPTATLTITPRAHNAHDGLLTIGDGVTWEPPESPILLIKGIPVFQHPNTHGFTGEEYWLDSKPVKLTAVDDNACKSPPERRFWIRHHGSGGGPDWGDWGNQDRHHGLLIRIKIIDDDCTYLAASPGQVSAEEGGSATYTVHLKKPHAHTAWISPRISAPGDSDINAITVSPQRIRVEAGDTSPKTFTVSAGRDADSRDEVLHVDHSVDSPGIPADYLGARVTVVVMDPQKQEPARKEELTVTGLALTAGSETVALSPAFSTNVLSYRATVPAGTTSVTLAPHWSGGESVFTGSRNGATSYTRPTRVRTSGTAVDLALAPDGGATELYVMVSGSGGLTTYRIDVTAAPPEPQTITAPDDTTPEQQQQQTAEPVETPGPVVNLQLTAKGEKVIVSWQAPASGGASDRYIVHIKNMDTGKGKDRKVAAGKTTTTFRNLKVGTTYRVWVRAQNETGKGERVHARITLPDSAVQGGEGDPPPEPAATPTPEPTAIPTPEPESETQQQEPVKQPPQNPDPEPEQPEPEQQQAVVTCDGRLTLQDVIKANTDAASGAITREAWRAIQDCWDKQRGH